MQKIMLPREVEQASNDLLNAVFSSAVYQNYMDKKRLALEKVENAALLRRYQELQVELNQLADGQEPDDAMRRDFEKLNMLVFDDDRLSAYVMAKMKLEMMLGQIVESIVKIPDDGIPSHDE